MERMTPDTIDFNSLSKKQLVELVITKYNDCFRLEEENKKLREDSKSLESAIGDVVRENRRLKGENEELKEAMKELNNYNKFRIQENEKLKEKLNKAGLEEYGFFNEH